MALTKINSNLISNNTVANTNIADNAVDATKIASNSILTRHIDDAQITTDQILDGTIATADIADDAVTEDKLANAINTSIAAKLPLAGGTMTGDVTFNGTNLYFNGAASSASYNLALENSDTFTSFYGSTSSSIDKGYKFFVGNQGGDLAFTINANKSIAIAGTLEVAAASSLRLTTVKSTGGGSELALTVTDASNNSVFQVAGGGTAAFQYGPVLVAASTDIMHANMDDLQVGNAVGNRGLTVASGDGSYGTLAFADGSSGNAAYRGFVEYFHNEDSLRLGTSGTEKMRITSGGDIVIGATSKIYSSGDTDSYLQFNQANTLRAVIGDSTRMIINTSETVFNEDSGNFDFRIESDGNTNMFWVDASSNAIAIGSDNLLTTLHVDAADNELTMNVSSGLASTNTWQGIGFGARNSMKGGILYRRTGSHARGQLLFCTENTADNAHVDTGNIRMAVDADGTIQLGNPDTGAATNVCVMPTGKLFLDAGGDTYISEDAANQMAFFTGGAKRFALIGGAGFFSGTVTASHSFSDERLKENITVIPNALDKIKTLRGITFTRKSDGSSGTGLIAQELEKVLPDAVYETKTMSDDDDDTEYKAITYEVTVGLLVEGIKEQQTIIDDLKARITTLEG